MANSYTYTVGDIVQAQTPIFTGRSISQLDCARDVRKVVLELTENYPFPGLERTGPVTPLVAYNSGPYDYDTFLQPQDAGLEINELDSFFIYTNGLFPVPNQQNAGYPLRFKTIDTLEILLNTPGLPTNWTRYNGSLYFAMQPIQIYYVYLRYQFEHPFPNAGTADALTDQILLPNSWQDIIELATAERQARNFNLSERRSEFYNMLYGDPKFQLTGGTQGAPGLVFARTSQKQRDQETSVKSLRLMMRRSMR